MKRLVTLLILCCTATAYCDSPLTSTPFASSCGAEQIISRFKINGFSDDIMQFLSDPKADAVQKIGLINEIGWGNMQYVEAYQAYLIAQHKGLSNAVFGALKSNKGTLKALKKMTKKLSADELMCWAYLQAMGDYFQPALANKAATIAYQRTKESSMAHAAVYALIRCQIAFDQNWCEIYRVGNEYFRERNYKSNLLSEDAIRIIMEYLDLYKGDC